MKKILLISVLTFACFSVACSNIEEKSTGDESTSKVTENTTTTTEPENEEGTVEEMTGHPSGEIQWKYVMYNGVVYTHDNAVRRHIDESEVTSKFKDYEKIGTVNIDNLNMPDEELDGSRFEDGANLYAKQGNDAEVYVYSVDTLYRMIPYKR